MIFVLDNYDSFTYNLVQYLGELGADPVVRRNDQVAVTDVERMAPAGVLISPGPGIPSRAGITIPLIRWCVGRVPLLGVCLGHQGLAAAFGGEVVRAERLMHGKTSEVAHSAEGILLGLPSPFRAMRYHSLLVSPASLPAELRVTAWTTDRPRGAEIMAIQHVSEPAFGVQFHPESIGTDIGKQLMANYLGYL